MVAQKFTKKTVYQCMMLLVGTLTVYNTHAATTPWKIDTSSSSVVFIGNQNNIPVSGLFKTFGGTINFDPEQLLQNQVAIDIDTQSITMPTEAMTEKLKSAEWFNAKTYTKASYTTNAFTRIDTQNYMAQGMLTIRDKSLPVTVQFNWQDLTPTTARVRGGAIVKRSNFGIGTTDWGTTDLVKDDVQINFSLSLKK